MGGLQEWLTPAVISTAVPPFAVLFIGTFFTWVARRRNRRDTQPSDVQAHAGSDDRFARDMYAAMQENAERLQQQLTVADRRIEDRDKMIDHLRAEVDRLWRVNIEQKEGISALKSLVRELKLALGIKPVSEEDDD